MILRLVWAVISIATYELLTLRLTILGFLVVPLAIYRGQWQISPINGRTIFTAPRWLWLWGNLEDGYDPQWYREANPEWGAFKRMYIWAAIRNSVNNLRFIKALNPPPVPERIRFAAVNHSCTLCWQGAFSRIVWTSKTHWYGCGWKYDPQDQQGISDKDWRRFGVGFGIRRKPL